MNTLDLMLFYVFWWMECIYGWFMLGPAINSQWSRIINRSRWLWKQDKEQD